MLFTNLLCHFKTESYFSTTKFSMRTKLLLSCLLFIIYTTLSAQQKGYYRTPAIYQNTVVFTAEGDLWKYDITSGVTARLTTNAGVETSPIISPDGKMLVFTGEYEGVSELYSMNINGSVPKRLTYDFDGGNTMPCGYTKEGKILYRSSKYSLLPGPQLLLLDPTALTTQQVPLAEASYGCYDENGLLFFTRFPNQGSKTKRYKGGYIEQIWKFDGKQEASNITADFDGTSTSPMYFSGKVYFLSDRDGTMNLWSMNKDGKELKQNTFSKGWDLQSATIGSGKIVYQKGADIWLYDIASNKEKLLEISLLSDFDQRKPRWIKSPANSISYADISPNGNYAAIISRGRLFVSPSKSDRWVEVVRRSGIRFKQVHFINEKSVAVLSDESGEFEIWKINADGSDSARQLTKNTTTLITSFAVSPNEKHIAYTDKNDVLRITETATGTVKYKTDSTYEGLNGLLWSPNSRFLNFTRSIANTNAQVWVVDINTFKDIPITTTRLNSYSPAWSADSSWIFFLSERNLHTKVRSPWGSRQPEPYYTEATNLYAMPLDSTAKFPFLQKDSWLTDTIFNPVPKKEVPETAKSKKKKDKPAILPTKIYDWQRAQSQLYQLPIKSGNIYGMDAADGYLYWADYGTDGPGPDGAKLFTLKIEPSKKYEPVEVASGVSGFTLSANKKKILVTCTNKTIAIADADGSKIDMDKSKLELDNWNFSLNPTEDWKEIFADAWRMMRDYFYDRDLHKVDWTAVRKQYEPLVERVTDRYELDDLISQMVGELSALHTFVGGGDKRRSPDMIQTGFLGARLAKTDKGLAIEHIYKADPDYPEFSSPLNRPALSIKEGDIITAINNVPISQVQNIAELLANKVDIPVKLSLINKANKPYEEVVKLFSAGNEFDLKYQEWEITRRNKVDSLSNNDIGYVHLQNMGSGDMDDFVKQFYPVFNRSGLILDVRHNGGGNVDSWILEKLMRKAWMYWQSRAGQPFANMPYAFSGHMVILCDQITASDGEAITEGFRRLGLGKVIGMRTWGGEIWLSFSNRLVDNGIASAAENGVYGTEGTWLIEGRGVEPDITVDNLPFATFNGKDAQLETAVDYLKKLIKEKPVVVPKAPAYPDKSFKY